MDKTKLKKHIRNFATNVALVVMMATLVLTYIPIVIKGQGHLVLTICDAICIIIATCFAVSDWKEIKTMLVEPEKNR